MVLLWWVGFDLGKGVIKIYQKFQIIPSNVKPDLSYKDYDWTIDLELFYRNGSNKHLNNNNTKFVFIF
jgi:hypothetical protein